MADNTNDNLTVTVQLTSKVPGALLRRFVKYETSSPNFREVITLVPGANGGFAVGVLAEAIDTTLSDGFYSSSMVKPGGITEVVAGENLTHGAPLRAGGNGAETDGAAYLADTTGDIIIAYALHDATAGAIVNINFVGYAGTVA